MAQPQRPYRNPNRVPPRRPAPPSARDYGLKTRRRSSGCGLVIVALLAVLCVGGAYTYNKVSDTINVIGGGVDVRPSAATAGPPPALLQTPFNVLVIGVDLRANSPDDGARSDTLIVVHVDPVQRWASMLSIPRDTLVTIPSDQCENAGGTRVNAAYSCGYRRPEIYGLKDSPENRANAGAALAAQTVEQFLGIKINYTAQIDFNGFQQIVDALGGVTLDVPKDILDAEYPTEDNGYMRLYIPAGLQRMDGVSALRYARTRHADNDFGRAARQQQVLQAILNEIKSQGVLGQIEAAPRLLDIARQSVRTTIQIKDPSTLRGLADLAQNLPPERIQRLVIKPEQNPDGSSTLLSDLSSVLEWDPAYIRRMAQQLELPPGAAPQAPVVVQVQNGTFIRGLAGQVTVDLEEIGGFTTAQAADAPQKGIPNTLILNYTGQQETAQRLADFLQVDPQYIQDLSGESAPPNVDIVVRLGDDYQAPADVQGARP